MPSLRLLIVFALLGAARVAAAQPAPVVPVDPYASDPAPDPAAAVEGPGADTVEPVPPPPPWDPLDDDGWPRGVSLEQLRHLRRCHLDEQLPGPGEIIPCRPDVIAETPQWAFAADWTTGIVAGKTPITGGAQALGVELGFGLTRSLALGVRYELMGFGQPSSGDDMLVVGVSHRLFANARHRFFTDEADRDAWTLGLGGGWAFQEASLGGGAPILRASFGREVGMYLDDENAVLMGLELAYERNLDDAQLSAVLASARFGFEVNIREPRNLGTVDEPPSTAYTRGVDIYLGPALGLGYSLGVPLADHLEVNATAGFLFGLTDFGKQSGLDGSQWALQAGARITPGWPRPASLYLQAQVGPVWVSHDPSREVALAVDTELGVSPGFTCDGRLDFALRVRTEIEDEAHALWGALVVRVAFGQGRTRSGRRCGGGGGGAIVTMPLPPPPPPEPVLAPPPDQDLIGQGGTTIDGSAGGTIDGSAGGAVTVEVPVPEPVVIEVELGGSWLGGAVQVRIDPRLLPLARLRAAGHVEIELTGPADALVDYEVSLRAVLDREGIRAASWVRTATSDSVIRARFTLK